MSFTETVIEKRDPHNGLVKLFAHLISYIFHPLFIPVYVTAFLAYIHPSCFSGYHFSQKNWVIIRIVYTMVFFPALTVWLLKRLGFIKSIFLESQQDRIIPYIASNIFYFWAYLVFRNQPNIPHILTSFTFAVFLSSAAALLANIYLKISMHAIGMGGLIGLFLIIMQQNTMLMTWPLSLAFLVTGLVCTARFIISNHTQKEIYSGLLTGLICQFIGAMVV
jgi:hypothetical protein